MWDKTFLIDLLNRELQQDDAANDVTTRLLADEGQLRLHGRVKSRVQGVFAGKDIVEGFQEILGDSIEFSACSSDGARIEPGQSVVEWSAAASDSLRIERTLLNLLSHTCGIATQTRRFVDAVAGFQTKILATRKTLPGLRAIQLAAVVAGGGYIHRRSLSDGVLIKENHQSLVPGPELIARARATRSPLHGIEIEVQNPADLPAVLASKPDVIMLDNFSVADAQSAIKEIAGRARIEISGGINLKTVRAYAELGVDYISVGQLTHSVTALDLGLDLERE